MSRLRGRLARVQHEAHTVCQRCDGSGLEPGGPSDEDIAARHKSAALAEAERKAERAREVRAALGPAVIDVKPADERPSFTEPPARPVLRLVTDSE